MASSLQKKTNDGGIDGRIYFSIPDNKNIQVMKLEVKGGQHVGIGVVRELKGMLNDDCCAMVGLITMEPILGTKLKNFQKRGFFIWGVGCNGLKIPQGTIPIRA